jgi:hypothetical protein
VITTTVVDEAGSMRAELATVLDRAGVGWQVSAGRIARGAADFHGPAAICAEWLAPV